MFLPALIIVSLKHSLTFLSPQVIKPLVSKSGSIVLWDVSLNSVWIVCQSCIEFSIMGLSLTSKFFSTINRSTTLMLCSFSNSRSIFDWIDSMMSFWDKIFFRKSCSGAAAFELFLSAYFSWERRASLYSFSSSLMFSVPKRLFWEISISPAASRCRVIVFLGVENSLSSSTIA